MTDAVTQVLFHKGDYLIEKVVDVVEGIDFKTQPLTGLTLLFANSSRLASSGEEYLSFVICQWGHSTETQLWNRPGRRLKAGSPGFLIHRKLFGIANYLEYREVFVIFEDVEIWFPLRLMKENAGRGVYIYKKALMKKKKTYSFSTEMTPETEISMSGRFGQPLDMRFSSSLGQMTVSLDTESIIRLQAFLNDYLEDSEETEEGLKYFQPTGRALALMDGETLDIQRIFMCKDFKEGVDMESPSYGAIIDALSEIVGQELPNKPIIILFDTFDGSIGRGKLRRIIRACIAFQVDFVKTGDFSKCRRMVLEDIEAFTNIDITQVSRATKSVLILTEKQTYSLNSNDMSLSVPSLFDEGIECQSGHFCSRKEVLVTIRELIAEENPRKPLTDEQIQDELNKKGYIFSRRTVAKYREEFLDIRNSHIRRVL